MRCPRIALLGAAVTWLSLVPGGVGAEGDATLAARVAHLEALLADRDREITQLREYSQRLLDDLEATRTQLGAAERGGATEHRLRQEESGRLRRELIASQTSLQKEISKRDKELAKLRAEVASLRPRVVEQEELRATFSEEMEKIRSATIAREADLVTRLAKEETSLAEARKDLESLGSKVADLEASLATARAEGEKTSAAAADLDRELQASRAEGARWLAELESRKREEESLRSELATKEEELGKGAEAFAALRSSSEEATEKLHSQVVTIESSFDAERERREALESEVRELRTQNRELSRELARARVRSDEAGRDEDSSDAAPKPMPVAALAAEEAPAGRLAERLRSAVEAARGENDALERGIRKLRDETAHARELAGQIAEYDLRIRELRSSAGGAAEGLAELVAARGSADAELHRVRRSIAASVGTLDAVAADAIRLPSRVAGEAGIPSVRGAFETERRRRERLSRELGRIRSAAVVK